jgi:hypothetical protein
MIVVVEGNLPSSFWISRNDDSMAEFIAQSRTDEAKQLSLY